MFARFSRRHLLGGLLPSVCGPLLPKPPALPALPAPDAGEPPLCGSGTAYFPGTSGAVGPSALVYSNYPGASSSPDRPAGPQAAPPQEG
jgi:hypothetical protein